MVLMSDFYHFMNMRSPIDGPSLAMLAVLGQDYRLSLPIEGSTSPEITPVSQDEMIKNGIVGVYVTTQAALKPEMRPHTPFLDIPVDHWLIRRKRL